MGIVSAIISMLFAGISAYLYKRCSPTFGPTNTTFFYYLCGSLIAALVWLGARERVSFSRSELIWPFLTALTLFVSIWAFNFSLQQINVSLASPIRSMSFVITAMLAVTLSGERLFAKDYVALVLVAAAILVFSFGGSSNGGETAHSSERAATQPRTTQVSATKSLAAFDAGARPNAGNGPH
jgi:drug/metabolite transporter (DMT)-like permease